MQKVNLIQLLNRYTYTITVNQGYNTSVKQIERCKVKIRLYSKLIAIGYSNYLCLNSILGNGHQHNSPQFQVQLEAIYEFFF